MTSLKDTEMKSVVQFQVIGNSGTKTGSVAKCQMKEIDPKEINLFQGSVTGGRAIGFEEI